jgi:4'-phosphopantetheinyl transferase
LPLVLGRDMPLIQIKDIDVHASWALWEITETPEELTLHKMCEHEKKELEQIHNSRKRLEWLAARNALQYIFGNNNIEKKSVLKDVFGKPFLFGAEHQISLAHSYPYAVALFNRIKPAGIDIEKVQDKILRIGKKFLNDKEKEIAGADTTKMTIIWCAKEALYKFYGRKKLIFRENMFIAPFELQDEGEITGVIEYEDLSAEIILYYIVLDGYVICYTK